MLDKRRPHFLLQGRASRKQKEEEEEDDAELQCKRETRHALQGECRRKDGRGRGRCSPPPLIKKRDRRREIRRVSRTTFAATDANDATTDADGHATSPPSFRASRPPFLPLFLFSLLPSSRCSCREAGQRICGGFVDQNQHILLTLSIHSPLFTHSHRLSI